jgi:hypothetical protein
MRGRTTSRMWKPVSSTMSRRRRSAEASSRPRHRDCPLQLSPPGDSAGEPVRSRDLWTVNGVHEDGSLTAPAPAEYTKTTISRGVSGPPFRLPSPSSDSPATPTAPCGCERRRPPLHAWHDGARGNPAHTESLVRSVHALLGGSDPDRPPALGGEGVPRERSPGRNPHHGRRGCERPEEVRLPTTELPVEDSEGEPAPD